MQHVARTAVLVGSILVALGQPPATAIINPAQARCQEAILKAHRLFVSGLLRLEQRCRDANLRFGAATCPVPPAPGPVAVALDRARERLAEQLRDRLAKHCDVGPSGLASLGFPGRCLDVDPADGFTLADLTACLQSSTERALHGTCAGGTNLDETCDTVADCPDAGTGTACRALLSAAYDPTVVGPLPRPALACQTALAHGSRKFLDALLKAVAQCHRNIFTCRFVPDHTPQCRLDGIPPWQCVWHSSVVAAIDRARERAIATIERKCRDAPSVASLKPCEPDQTTAAAAATCIVDMHGSVAVDLLAIDLPEPAFCGNGRHDQPTEECDGPADAACPGQCGGPDGVFPCLCQDGSQQRRIRVVAGSADLDLGWSGAGHDSGIVSGDGYLTDLWDCDGPSGPDTLCTVGPSCNLPPHEPCSPSAAATGAAAGADTLCPGPGNYCRVTAAGATGPHCERTVTQRCRHAGDCPTPGDRCVTTSGAPVPLASGGVSVCIVNSFTEDVTGTVDLATGEGAVRQRLRSATFIGGSLAQPCPVCGGFCSGSASTYGPGLRTPCQSNADCGTGAFCVTENICSWGPDIDQPCRPNPPHGGATAFFGNPSRDCRMAGSPVGTLDLLLDPSTTGTTTLTANQPCNTPGFTEKTCAGGPNQHAICTVDSECPGGACNHQCFCAGGWQRPNACGAACVGGPDDASPCADDADCGAPGFCHRGDCRPNPSDTDSVQEGLCSVGPSDGRCSVHSFIPCSDDTTCRAPQCPFCEPGETCVSVQRQCFVNPTIVRAGAPGIPDRTAAAVFCFAGTDSTAVNSIFGVPGPGAITQVETVFTAAP